MESGNDALVLGIMLQGDVLQALTERLEPVGRENGGEILRKLDYLISIYQNLSETHKGTLCNTATRVLYIVWLVCSNLNSAEL